MTDDFHLFGDPSDGNEPIDPDIALVTAYLARELSPMQVLALEERLATDAAFRAEMQPLIDAWAAPVPSLVDGLAQRAAPLSVLERAESWRRFQSEGVPAVPTEPMVLDPPPARTIRRISMKRIALLTAAFAVPMVSFAEVVVYAANHAGLPGHALAQRVVSAFAKKPTSRHDSPTSEPASRVTSELTDGRLPRPLNATKAVATESITVAPAPTPTTSAVTPAPRTPSIPNRALIAELTRQHHPELVRGDSSAEYVVMVLDAADGYVWSTSGNGNVGIEVGSDSRSIRDRAAFTYEYRDEFWGDVSSRAAARGGNMNGGFGAGAGGRARGGGGGVMRIDSLAGAGGGRGGGGGRGSIGPDSAARAAKRSARGGAGVNMRITRGDTIYTLRYDSLFVYFSRPDGVIGQGAIARETLRGGFGGGRGRGGFEPRTTTSVSGGYRAGWTGNAAGVLLNRALGLEPPTAERSGVQGLAPSFVESADTYFFAPREISSSNLRVMVIHLTPNATWRGPS